MSDHRRGDLRRGRTRNPIPPTPEQIAMARELMADEAHAKQRFARYVESLRTAGVSVETLAAELGVSRSTIYRIVPRYEP